MSVRSEKVDATTAAMNQMDLSATASFNTEASPAGHVSATIAAAQQADSALSEANALSVSSPEHPITRQVAITIRSSLGDLCLRKAKGQWAPTQSALKQMFQKKKFTSLGGAAEGTGDLRSVVLHDMTMTHMSSDFPMPVGANITAVDANTYSVTGDAFGYIAPANSASTVNTKLQADDTSLAYEFARKFPGYTAENLGEKGIHEVAARRFCLVAADHPLVSAIQENQEKLQLGDVSMMPEGLVKIGQDLYNAVMPVVTQQVASQIRVRDLSAAKVTLAPSEQTSWSDARNELVAESKSAMRAELETALSAASDDVSIEKLRKDFAAREAMIEHNIDSKVHTFSAQISVTYNFLSK